MSCASIDPSPLGSKPQSTGNSALRTLRAQSLIVCGSFSLESGTSPIVNDFVASQTIAATSSTTFVPLASMSFVVPNDGEYTFDFVGTASPSVTFGRSLEIGISVNSVVVTDSVMRENLLIASQAYSVSTQLNTTLSAGDTVDVQFRASPIGTANTITFTNRSFKYIQLS